MQFRLNGRSSWHPIYTDDTRVASICGRREVFFRLAQPVGQTRTARRLSERLNETYGKAVVMSHKEAQGLLWAAAAKARAQRVCPRKEGGRDQVRESRICTWEGDGEDQDARSPR